MTGQIDVFISYKREERAWSEHVKRALISAGYTALTDLNIAKNQDFGDAIDTMIRAATLTMVLWTKASAASDWVRKEARLARDLEMAGKRNRYIGVMVEDVDLDLPPDLRGLQMVDIREGGLDARGIAEILDAAHEVLGVEAQQNAQNAEADSAALSEEWQLYDIARSINVAASYERYLLRYPNGEFAHDARRQLGMFTWYLHPLRRGNISNTLAALGIAGTVLTATWGASRDPVIIGVDRDDHSVVMAERDTAIRQAQVSIEEKNDALARLAAATESTASLKVERDNAIRRVQVLIEEKNDALARLKDIAPSELQSIPTEPKQQVLQVLGLTLVSMTQQLSIKYKAGSVSGLAVVGVDETSEAYEKGIRISDVITEAGQQPTNSVEELIAIIRRAEETGRKSLLLLLRRETDPRFVALSL